MARKKIAGPRPEVVAFLDSIKDEPDDDTPRLVLADWLEEHGDEADVARARYLRLTCEMRKMADDDPRRVAVSEELYRLRQQHQAAWLGPLADLHEVTRWNAKAQLGERGMVGVLGNALTLSAKHCTSLAATEAFAWVDSLRLRAGGGSTIAKVLASPLLRKLNELNFNGVAIRADGARQLGRLGGQLASLTELDLNGNFVEHEGVKALANAAALANLRALNLYRNMIRRDSVAVLAGSPYLRRLHRLILGSQDLADGLRHLAGAEWMPGLRSLVVVEGRLTDAGVAPLVSSAACAGLMELELPNNLLTDASLEAIAASPHLGKLTHLNVGHNRIEESGIRALASSPLFGRLQELNVSYCAAQMGVGLVRLLAESSHWNGLRRLRLGGVQLGREGAELLDQAARKGAVQRLELAACPLGDDGVQVLADSLREGRIQKLSAWGWQGTNETQSQMESEFGERVWFDFF